MKSNEGCECTEQSRELQTSRARVISSPPLPRSTHPYFYRSAWPGYGLGRAHVLNSVAYSHARDKYARVCVWVCVPRV